MIYMTVTYRREEGKHFDMDYFINKHIYQIMNAPGGKAVNVSVYEGTQGFYPNTPHSFFCIIVFTFHNLEDLEETFELAGDTEGDIINYTNVIPEIQINKKVL